ncbi:HET-domain-containing protein [Parathielavia appendiculata]|uniref:HET-domain-containing protein n=1 Tax=Parathielavia appendiculata TaxID=2587402 RepID=A0AAN6Z2E4_9PEZI|nr:HET-domain-containing protein [Parathielavia appendiculata]
MRLIDTSTLEFSEFLGPTTPRYAILSHTWGADEVSLQDMELGLPSLASKEGYRKVVDYCRLAAQQGYGWAWVDTCCIDKTNHAELAESINSMFRWYQEAAVCHVFLSDLGPQAALGTALPPCRWFTRGWTLQELIAPATVEFYDGNWVMRGTKASLITQLESITGILASVLAGSSRLANVSVGVRMSWAANRETTRPEDMAYSLLGIFDVNMPMIYGEGEKAFRRLQEEIIRQSNDLTIFAWQDDSSFYRKLARSTYRQAVVARSAPLLALSPRDFGLHSAWGSRGSLRRLGFENGSKWSDINPEYAITNKGLRITTSLVLHDLVDEPAHWVTKGRSYFLALGELRRHPEDPHGNIVGLLLDKLGPDVFSRREADLCEIPETAFPMLTQSMTIYIVMSENSFYANREAASRQGTFRVRDGRVPIRSQDTEWRGDQGSAQTPHVSVRVLRAIPQRYWDHTNQRFFCTPGNATVLAFSVGVSLDQYEVVVVCLVDLQRPRGQLSWPVLFLYGPGEAPDLMSWFMSRKAAGESTFWEDLPVHWLQWPRSRHSLKISVNGVSYSVSAQVNAERERELRAGFPRWIISFDVMRHSAADTCADGGLIKSE